MGSIATLLIKIAAEIEDYHGNLCLRAKLNQQNGNAVLLVCMLHCYVVD